MITEFLIQFSYIILFILVGLLVSNLISNYQQTKLRFKFIALDSQIEDITANYKLSLKATKKVFYILELIPIYKILESLPEKDREDIALELVEVAEMLEKIKEEINAVSL